MAIINVLDANSKADQAKLSKLQQEYESQKKIVLVDLDSKHDPTNNPSLLKIGSITMPSDVIIFINGKKVLVHDKILDGVSIIERISREPYEIEIECTLRQANDSGTVNADYTTYIFPQKQLNLIWQKLWLPDTVQKVDNTYLNGLGISEIIIETITPLPKRGNKDIQLTIKAFENVPGQTLIIT